MRVCEENYAILRRAENILKTDYEINLTNDDECKGFIDDYNVAIMIDNLCTEIDLLKEQLQDQEEHYEELIRDCYKPISPYEMYGVNEHDFY